MSHIEEYYNKWLDEMVINNNNVGCMISRESIKNNPSYAFQPSKDAFIYLENALRKEFNKKLSAKAYENTMLEKDVMALKSEVETLKKALADTLAALAAK
jgi:hypothetical protein